MHALKKVGNQWLAASLAYSGKDCKGIEIKSVKEKMRKEKKNRDKWINYKTKSQRRSKNGLDKILDGSIIIL